MRLLFFGTYDAGAHPRVAVLRQGASALGATYTEVNRPLGFTTAERVETLRRPFRNVPIFAWRLVRCWTGLALDARRHVRRDGRPDAVVVGYMGHFDVVLARLLFPRRRIVLDHLISASDTARDRNLGGSLRQRLLVALDHVALAAADIVLVDTEEHLATLPPRFARKGLVVEVGAPYEWFVERPSVGRREALSVVFFGLFTPLQGTMAIAEAISKLADEAIDFTIIGTGQDYLDVRAAVQDDSRVTWIEWVPGADLPEMVAAHDACLGIFGDGPKALRVVPNKVFQGAAAGCAIVTSDTAPQRRVLGDAAILVPPGDGTALADALFELATHPDALEAARRRSKERAVAAFAPSAVVAPLVRRLEGR